MEDIDNRSCSVCWTGCGTNESSEDCRGCQDIYCNSINKKDSKCQNHWSYIRQETVWFRPRRVSKQDASMFAWHWCFSPTTLIRFDRTNIPYVVSLSESVLDKGIILVRKRETTIWVRLINDCARLVFLIYCFLPPGRSSRESFDSSDGILLQTPITEQSLHRRETRFCCQKPIEW